MIKDLAHVQTDAIIDRINRDLRRSFSNEYRIAREAILKVLAKLNINKNMSNDEIILEANKYNRFDNMVEILTNGIKKSAQDGVQQINSGMKQIYRINYNYMVDKINKKSKANIQHAKTNEIAKASKSNPMATVAMNRDKSQAVISNDVKMNLWNAMIVGAGIGVVTQAIRSSFDDILNSQARIAMTTATYMENSARQDVFDEARDKYGIVVSKKWNTMEDDKVRDAHARVDGQTVQSNKEFVVDGEDLEYPGDINGSLSNIINCRCFITEELDEV